MATRTVTNTITNLRTRGKPIWKVVPAQATWEDGNSDTINSTVYLNGIIKCIKINPSNSESSNTLTVSITDLDGNSIYTTGNVIDPGTFYIKKANDTDYKKNQLSFYDGFIISITSGDPGSGGSTADIEVLGI